MGYSEFDFTLGLLKVQFTNEGIDLGFKNEGDRDYLLGLFPLELNTFQNNIQLEILNLISLDNGGRVLNQNLRDEIANLILVQINKLNFALRQMLKQNSL